MQRLIQQQNVRDLSSLDLQNIKNMNKCQIKLDKYRHARY